MSDRVAELEVQVSDGVAVLLINRPKVNALDLALQRRIGEVAVELDGRDDVAAVVLTGGDRVFAAGSDVKEFVGSTAAAMAEHCAAVRDAYAAVARLGKPVVAAINGYALGGGCELALCADRRIAADNAILGQPEIKLGLIPGAGGTQRLARLIGPARAKELAFTGRFVKADEALRIGLVDEVVPAAEVLPAAIAWARQFVAGPALALRAAKTCVDDGLDVDLDSGLDVELRAFAALLDTEDADIGLTSFLERGPGQAQFVGR